MDPNYYWTQEELTARTIQMQEYFGPSEISTNFFELADEVSDAFKMIHLMELKDLITELGAFYIPGSTSTQ